MVPRLVEQQGIGLALHAEVQADCMVRLARVLEEILDGIQQARTSNLGGQFLAHFTHQRGLPILTGFDAPARQCPECIALETVQQDKTPVDHHGRRTQLKTMASNIHGNHPHPPWLTGPGRDGGATRHG